MSCIQTPGRGWQILWASILLATPALGDDATNAIEELNQMSIEELLNMSVVTASGGAGETRAMASANVSVVSKEDIAAHGWRSLSELLVNVPGLYVIDDLVIPSLGVRGVNGGPRGGTRLVRVMVDGVQVNYRPDLTAFIGPEFIPMEAVERVEIAKGPLSSVYGANAFLATVNVITRKPSEGRHAQIALRTGLHKYKFSQGASASFSLSDGQTWFLAAASADSIDRSGLVIGDGVQGLRTDPSLIGVPSENDFSYPSTVFAQFATGAPTGFGTLTLKGGMQHLNSAGEFQINSVLTHRSRVALRNTWANLQHTKEWSPKLTSTMSLGVALGEPLLDYQLYVMRNFTSSFRPNHGYQAINGTASVSYDLFSWLSLKVGVDFENELERILYYTETFNGLLAEQTSPSSRDLIEPTADRHDRVIHLAGYFQIAGSPFSLVDKLRLTADLRVDTFSHNADAFPTQFSWRAAAAYQWNPKLVTKIIAGRAFQIPSGVLLYARPGFGNTNNLIGNRFVSSVFLPLKQQKVLSVEGNVSASVASVLTVEAAVYYQFLEDKIQFSPISFDFTPRNGGQSSVTGLESTLRLRLGRVTAFASGNIQADTSAGTFSFKAPSLFPSFMGVVGADVDIREAYLRLTVEARGVGPRGASESNVFLNLGQDYELPGYADFNIYVSTHNLNLFGKETPTRFIGSVQNMLAHGRFEPGFGGIDLPVLGRKTTVHIEQQF